MAAFAHKVSRYLCPFNSNFSKTFLGQTSILVNSNRNSGFFRHLAREKEHNQDNYEYEVTKDPNEWQHVERLMPLVTVPFPAPKESYPSGWRPVKEESLQHPYFVERSRNHMLSVYLKIQQRGQVKITKICRIRGDIWALHDELKTYVQEQAGKKIASYVHEGNNAVHFRGDYVYYVEQWMLSKGF